MDFSFAFFPLFSVDKYFSLSTNDRQAGRHISSYGWTWSLHEVGNCWRRQPKKKHHRPPPFKKPFIDLQNLEAFFFFSFGFLGKGESGDIRRLQYPLIISNCNYSYYPYRYIRIRNRVYPVSLKLAFLPPGPGTFLVFYILFTKVYYSLTLEQEKPQK